MTSTAHTASQSIAQPAFGAPHGLRICGYGGSYSVTLPSMSARLSACTAATSATSATPSRSPSSFAFCCTGFWISPCCGRKPAARHLHRRLQHRVRQAAHLRHRPPPRDFCAARKIHSGKRTHLVKNSVILYKKAAEISAVFFFLCLFSDNAIFVIIKVFWTIPHNSSAVLPPQFFSKGRSILWAVFSAQHRRLTAFSTFFSALITTPTSAHAARAWRFTAGDRL